VLTADPVEGEVAESGQDVESEVAVVGGPGGGSGLVGLLPDVDPFGERDLSVAGVEECFSGEFDVDLLRADLGGGFVGVGGVGDDAAAR
jgi:hypothetical protein